MAPTIGPDSPPRIIRRGGAYKPEIRLEVIDGAHALVKDFAVCGRWFRWLIGRWLVGRECRVLRAVEGIPGVPRLVARLSPYAIAVEHVGRSIAVMEPDELPANLWPDLERIVDELHGRGIAHADLKTLENILIDEAGAVHIVDFNSAVIRNGPLFRFVFPYVSADDRRAIVKAKLELQPHLVTPEDEAFFNERPWIERAFRGARRPIRRFAKWLGGKPAEPGPGRPSVQRRKQREAAARHDPPA
jgi:hypothetical protein